MASALGQFLVSIILVFLGMFGMIASYSRKPLLLKIPGLGIFHIDPDYPGRIPRAIAFGIGVGLCVIGVAFIALDKLHSLGFF